jgi:gamma-glutamylaminecyclotransferase
MIPVFVYGTLKRGFPFHPLGLSDSTFVSAVTTVHPYPMVIAGSFFGPMMLDEPGRGLRVVGELYSVRPDRLPKLDELEDVGRPGSFRARVEIVDGDATVEAIGFMKDERWLDPVHTGFLSDYQDTRFVPPWER